MHWIVFFQSSRGLQKALAMAAMASEEDSLWSDWGDLVQDLVEKSQAEEDAQEQQLKFVRSDSTSCISSFVADASRESRAREMHCGPKLWWARLLKEHTTFHAHETTTVPVTLISGCSGLCAEAEVLKVS